MQKGILGLLFLSFFGLGLAYAQDRKKPTEGSAAYAPTKVEWLELELNAVARQEMTTLNNFSLSYVNTHDEETITIYVHHTRKADRELITLAVDGARKLIELRAKHHGWDGWLKIKEKIVMYQ